MLDYKSFSPNKEDIIKKGPYTLLTYSSDHKNFLSMKHFFHELKKKIQNEKTSLVRNYSEERFKLEEQIMVSVGFFEGQAEIFSTVFRHPSWSKSVVRILNRYYRVPNRRDICFSPPVSMGLFLMLEDQTRRCFSMGKTSVFFCRPENQPKSTRFLSQILNKKSKFQWVFLPKTLYLVCPYPESPACWQLAVYSSSFDNQPLKLLSKKIKSN